MAVQRVRHRDLWMRYIAQCIIGSRPTGYPDIDDGPAESEAETRPEIRLDPEAALDQGNCTSTLLLQDSQQLTVEISLVTAQSLGFSSVGNELVDEKTGNILNSAIDGTYSDEEETIGDVPDIPATGKEEDTPDGFLIGADETDKIYDVVQQYLSSPESQTSSAVDQILALSAGGEQYPYDLVLAADKAMAGDELFAKVRIASVVSKQMFETYDAMTREWSNPDPKQQKLIFSLRRVMARFCSDTQYVSETLFIQDIELPSGSTPSGAGAHGDIYRVQHGSTMLALKADRTFIKPHLTDRLKKKRTILLGTSVILSRLRHDHVLPFLGFYEQKRIGSNTLFVVSPWMERGDIMSCMEILRQQRNPIPRIRWIYEIACGLRYLHDQRIVHGDLHAGSILVGADGHVRIGSYGLFELADQTFTTGILREERPGFSWYSAPELLQQGARPTYASDVWAFGCLCLLIWTGEGPFPDATTLFKLATQLSRTDRMPECLHKPMHAFHAAGSPERKHGAILRARVALPCWSRSPQARPQMALIGEIFRQRFSDIIAKPIEI